MTNMARLAQLAVAAEIDLIRVGIFAPDFGQREDVPNILLPEVYTRDNVNILQHHGKMSRRKMRLPDFLEAAYSTGTVTATNGSATVTSSEGAGAWGSAADHKPAWGDDQVSGDGRTITITDGGTPVDYEIKDVADDGATLTLTINYTGTGGGGLSYSIGTALQKVGTPDGNPVLHRHRLITLAAGVEVEYVLAFTKAHIYMWHSSYSAFVLKFTCSTACTFWDTESYDRQVIATNFVDKVQVWGSTIANAFANLTGDGSGIDIGGSTYLTKAKYVIAYENYVHLLYVEVNSNIYPEDIYWSAKNDETNFDETGAGDAGSMSIKGGGFITGAGIFDGKLIIGKEERMKYGFLVTGSDVFQFDDIEGINVGCRAAHSIINDKQGRLYWLASDYTIRRLPIGEVVSAAKDDTFKLINPALEKLIEAAYVPRYGHLLWSLPRGGGATANNIVVWYDLKDETMGEIDLAIPAFGKYARQTVMEWATLPLEGWDEWGWDNWSGPENVVGYMLDLCGDYSGYTYDMHSAEKDNSQEYTGHFVLSTDFVQKMIAKRYNIALHKFKRCVEMQLWLRNERAGTVAVAVKRDNETSWQSIDSVSLNDGAGREIFPTDIGMDKCDFRARHSLIKISGANAFTFYGIVMGFTSDGDR